MATDFYFQRSVYLLIPILPVAAFDDFLGGARLLVVG
jgi:hypothetical protein